MTSNFQVCYLRKIVLGLIDLPHVQNEYLYLGNPDWSGFSFFVSCSSAFKRSWILNLEIWDGIVFCVCFFPIGWIGCCRGRRVIQQCAEVGCTEEHSALSVLLMINGDLDLPPLSLHPSPPPPSPRPMNEWQKSQQRPLVHCSPAKRFPHSFHFHTFISLKNPTFAVRLNPSVA